MGLNAHVEALALTSLVMEITGERYINPNKESHRAIISLYGQLRLAQAIEKAGLLATVVDG